jgi:hypothetical protein
LVETIGAKVKAYDVERTTVEAHGFSRAMRMGFELGL